MKRRWLHLIPCEKAEIYSARCMTSVPNWLESVKLRSRRSLRSMQRRSAVVLKLWMSRVLRPQSARNTSKRSQMPWLRWVAAEVVDLSNQAGKAVVEASKLAVAAELRTDHPLAVPTVAPETTLQASKASALTHSALIANSRLAWMPATTMAITWVVHRAGIPTLVLWPSRKATALRTRARWMARRRRRRWGIYRLSNRPRELCPRPSVAWMGLSNLRRTKMAKSFCKASSQQLSLNNSRPWTTQRITYKRQNQVKLE